TYTVHSAYKDIKKKEENRRRDPDHKGESSRANDQADLWSFTWKLNVNNKIKNFLWRCLNRILPTNSSLHRRTGKGSPFCYRCENSPETIEHVFFFCEMAKEVWSITC
ncbi:hypothetical protein ACH5RR_004612, partial [Cinchona calisaya]